MNATVKRVRMVRMSAWSRKNNSPERAETRFATRARPDQSRLLLGWRFFRVSVACLAAGEGEIMKSEVQPGDIGLVEFPMSEKPDSLLHPALVLSVENTLSGVVYARVAYGTSQKISQSGHLPWEFVLTPEDGKAFVDSSLRKATRFDLRKTARIPVTEIRQIGRVDLQNRKITSRLRAALFASQ